MNKIITTLSLLVLSMVATNVQAFDCTSAQVQALVRQSVTLNAPSGDPHIQRLAQAVQVNDVNVIGRNPSTGTYMCNAVLVFQRGDGLMTSPDFNYEVARNLSNPGQPIVRTTGPGERFVRAALINWRQQASQDRLNAQAREAREASARYHASAPQRAAQLEAFYAAQDARLAPLHAAREAAEAKRVADSIAAQARIDAVLDAGATTISDAEIEELRRQRHARGY